MAASFRRRLLAIAFLTVLACGAAIAAVLFLSRVTLDERTAHARDNVTREVERMQSTMDHGHAPPNDIHSGELWSGYVTNTDANTRGPFISLGIEQAKSSHNLAFIERDDHGVPVLVASAPAGSGGYVFALQRVVAGRETRSLRVVVLVFALLSFGLVVASLRTLTAVQRDVSTLRSSLRKLGTDLHSPIARPWLSELNEVATGIAALAQDLEHAQNERETLTRELGERERLAALGRIAAGIAHEVRNPLASMKLRADLARTTGNAPPSVVKDLEDIATEISRLDRLVSDLLVLAGRRTPVREDIDVGALVQKRIALLLPWATERGVTFESKGSARASADSDAVARAIDNLLRNAVEASPPGSCVTISSETHERGARVAVIDHGSGITKDREKQLFEPFFTTKPDGTGLGLALARAVAHAHDGTLTYERDHGATRFVLEIG